MEAAWQEYCEAEHYSSDDDSSESSSLEPEGTTSVPVADSCPRLTASLGLLSPLDVRFSQMKMRHLFGDGRRIAEAIEAIRKVPCSEEESAAHAGAKWRLEFPFPAIEVVRWRCKLRDNTGRPRLDPNTGEEVYDSEENWFTLDNRRLYCLQEVALRAWPQRCVARVSEVLGCGPRHRMRELRKFRTMDSGRSIMVGSGADGVGFVRWSWREKAGVGASRERDGARAADGEKEGDVFSFLSALKQDDHERVDLSKKLSWILRREYGARTLGLAHGEGGWVDVKDLLQMDIFEGVSLEKFRQIVAESNVQKQRYELKEDEHGERIRACGKKAPASTRDGKAAPAAAVEGAPAGGSKASAGGEPPAAAQRAAPPERPPGLAPGGAPEPWAAARPGGAGGTRAGAAKGQPSAASTLRPSSNTAPGAEGDTVGQLQVGSVFKAAAARNAPASSSSSATRAGATAPTSPLGAKPTPAMVAMFQQMQAMNALRGMHQLQAGGMHRMQMFQHMKVMQQMQVMAAMRQRQQAQALYVAYQAQVRQQMAQLRAARQHQESHAQMLMWQQMQQEMQQMYEQQGGDWTQAGSGMSGGGGEWGTQEEWYGMDGDGDMSKWYGMNGEVGENGWGGGAGEQGAYQSAHDGQYDQAAGPLGAGLFSPDAAAYGHLGSQHYYG